MKTLVVLILAGIGLSMGSALLHLLRHKERSLGTVKALTLRIGLSIALFMLLMLSYALGWIKPHGLAERDTPKIIVPAPTDDNPHRQRTPL